MLKANITEFIVFIREKGVVGLAIGIIIGGAITQFVNALVEDFINPLLGILTGKVANLEQIAYQVPHTEIVFKVGHLLSSFINFVTIAAVVYFLFMKVPLLRDIDTKKE